MVSLIAKDDTRTTPSACIPKWRASFPSTPSIASGTSERLDNPGTALIATRTSSEVRKDTESESFRSLGASKLSRPSLDPSRMRKRSEEHTSELQSRENLVCRLLL